MKGLTRMNEATIANLSCGASLSCGVRQKSLAYPWSVGIKTNQVTGQDRIIGGRIRARREQLGVTITDLGLAYGGKRQTAQHWEAGKSFPPVSDLRRLCDLLKLDANELLGITDMKSLTDREIASARLNILTKASEARNPIQERLQRRQGRTG
jgi:transcriptional regulator with XRE-family HTH domain